MNSRFDHITVQDIQGLRSYLNTGIYPIHLEKILNKALNNGYSINNNHSNEIFINSDSLPNIEKCTINECIIKKIVKILESDYMDKIISEHETLTKDEIIFIFDKYSNLLFHITKTPDGVIIHL